MNGMEVAKWPNSEQRCSISPPNVSTASSKIRVAVSSQGREAYMRIKSGRNAAMRNRKPSKVRLDIRNESNNSELPLSLTLRQQRRMFCFEVNDIKGCFHVVVWIKVED